LQEPLSFHGKAVLMKEKSLRRIKGDFFVLPYLPLIHRNFSKSEFPFLLFFKLLKVLSIFGGLKPLKNIGK
jgi:hypothetical protein